MSEANSKPVSKPKSAPQKALEKLGLLRDIDLALHLPLRYEDETRITPIAQAHEGQAVQCEGLVSESQVDLRGRRQLLVKLEDESGQLLLRFIHFYPAQQRSMAVGQRLRVRGELRHGFFGREMVHPTFKAVDENTPLPSALSPVYPTSASLPQAYLRRAVTSPLQRAAREHTNVRRAAVEARFALGAQLPGRKEVGLFLRPGQWLVQAVEPLHVLAV